MLCLHSPVKLLLLSYGTFCRIFWWHSAFNLWNFGYQMSTLFHHFIPLLLSKVCFCGHRNLWAIQPWKLESYHPCDKFSLMVGLCLRGVVWLPAVDYCQLSLDYPNQDVLKMLGTFCCRQTAFFFATTFCFLVGLQTLQWRQCSAKGKAVCWQRKV